jgi:hypothetical protein
MGVQALNHPMLMWVRGVVKSCAEAQWLRKVFQMLSKRVQVGGTWISVDVTCLRSTRQPQPEGGDASGSLWR